MQLLHPQPAFEGAVRIHKLFRISNSGKESSHAINGALDTEKVRKRQFDSSSDISSRWTLTCSSFHL